MRPRITTIILEAKKEMLSAFTSFRMSGGPYLLLYAPSRSPTTLIILVCKPFSARIMPQVSFTILGPES